MKKLIFIIASLFLALTCYSQTPHTAVIHRDINWAVTGIVFIHPERIAMTKAQFNTAVTDGTFIYGSDTASMLTPYSLVSEANSAFNSGSGITIGGSNNINLGGTLDAPTTITGTEVNYIEIKMSDAGDRSVKFVFRPADGLSMRAYTGDDYTGDSGFFAVDSTTVIMAQYDGAAEKSVKIDTNNDTGILITDDDAGIGLIGAGNYSSVATSLSYTQKIYQDRNLGGQPVNATIYSPGEDEDGDLIMWDNETETYISLNVVPASESAGLMIVVMDTVLFSNTDQTTIVSLPVAAIIHDIWVYVVTTFNGSGTNQLDIGITGSEDRYESNLDVAVGAGFPTMSLTNIRDHMAGTTNITFDYDDQNSNASEGMLKVYVQYSIH